MNDTPEQPDTLSGLIRQLVENYPDFETARASIAEIILRERQELIKECVRSAVSAGISTHHIEERKKRKFKKKNPDDVMNVDALLGGRLNRGAIAASVNGWYDTMVHGKRLGDMTKEEVSDMLAAYRKAADKPDTRKKLRVTERCEAGAESSAQFKDMAAKEA